MKKADLHTHSYYSTDSDISPEQLVIKAKKIGLKHIALTDHDSIEGIEEFLKAGRKHKIDTIPGLEAHSEFGEILGYFIDHKNKDLIDLCKKNKESVNRRALKTIEKMAGDGYSLNPNEMRKKYNRDILERSMIVNELVEKGYVKSRREAFDNLLGKASKYYIKSNFLSTDKVIKIITAAEGAAVLSHPYVQDYKSEFKNIEKLIEAGLAGIEYPTILDQQIPSNYPENSHQITKQIKQLAKKYDLILTSGSDYHGSVIPTCELGSSNCHQSVIIALKQCLK